MARKTKVQQILEKSPEEIGSLSGQSGINTLRGYLKTLKYGYSRRVSSFKKQGLFSYAQYALEEELKSSQLKSPDKMTRNQLIHEIYRYINFFQSETSTKKGILRINKEQDKRIFGADSKGRPLKTMTNNEREKYWSMYSEFIHQNPTFTSKYGSSAIQTQLANVIFDNDDANIIKIFTSLKSELNKGRRKSRRRPNIYMGD